MATSLTTQVLIDGSRNFVIRVFGMGDSTGVPVTNAKIVDVTTLNPPAGPSFKITRIDYKVLGGIVQLSWDAPVPQPFAELQLADHLDWRYFGGESTRGVTSPTGSVLLSTLGFDVGSSYDLTLSCIKGIGTPTG